MADFNWIIRPYLYWWIKAYFFTTWHYFPGIGPCMCFPVQVLLEKTVLHMVPSKNLSLRQCALPCPRFLSFRRSTLQGGELCSIYNIFARLFNGTGSTMNITAVARSLHCLGPLTAASQIRIWVCLLTVALLAKFRTIVCCWLKTDCALVSVHCPDDHVKDGTCAKRWAHQDWPLH